MSDFVTAKISKDIDEILTKKSQKSKVPKVWIMDEVLREAYKDELSEQEEKEAIDWKK